MNKLNKKNILHCAQYAADYKGNFISSLINLESELTKSRCNISYLFPKEVSEKLWYNEFSKSHKCYLSNNVYHSESEILKIINDDNIDIIHTHFEGFDISSVKAVNKSKRDIKIVWHLHDHLSYVKNPIKKLYQIYCFYKHYNYYAKNVSIIAVSDEVKNFTLKYKSFLSSPFKFSRVIPNGIDINRIKSKGNSKSSNNKYSFLALGGRNQQKRTDLLVKAGLLLESAGGILHKNN